MEYSVTNAYFMRKIWGMGGTESHLYYLARRYREVDFVIFYYEADIHQLRRLRKYVRCIQVTKADRIRVKNLFVCYNRDILDHVKAENIYFVLHVDYLDMYRRGQEKKPPVDPRITKYLGVSQHVCAAWKELTGIDAEFIGEPVVIEDTPAPLLFVSATRLTKEKGWHRMKYLAKCLNQKGIRFIWMIFTNKDVIPEPNMILMPPRLDITDYFPMFDAYIQLSDNEGFCLSAVEALMKGIPVIGTDLPVFHEVGLDESNSVLIDMDMLNIPYERIKNIRELKVDYKEPADRWDEFIDPVPSVYVQGEIKVRATEYWEGKGLKDAVLGHVPYPGEEWFVDEERLDHLKSAEIRRNAKLVEVICQDTKKCST